MIQQSNPLNLRLDRHFVTCGVVGGAALALSGQQAAEAAITYIVPGSPIAVPATVDGLYLVLDTGFFGITAGATPGWDINPFLGGGNLDWFTNTSVGSANSIASSAVTGGTVQSIAALTDLATLTYDPSAYNLNSSAAILAGGTHFVAVTFVDGAAATNRAWIEITTTGPTGMPATVNRWAFAPIGETLLAGQVPEPGSAALGLLAAGAVGLRRRRAA